MFRRDRLLLFDSQQRSGKVHERRASLVGSSYARRLHVEALEDRRMLAVITVDSFADNTINDGLITLREAIIAANNDTIADATEGTQAGSGADTLLFDSALSGKTITLGGTELVITEALTIDATALTDNVTINANQQSRIFNITATIGDFAIAGLTITGGRTTGNNNGDTVHSGGAIRSATSGDLSIQQTTVSGNSTAGTKAYGGGIFALGFVTLTASTISGNNTEGDSALAGGIFSSFDATLMNSIVSGNGTVGNGSYGGGIFTFSDVTLTSSTISGNSTLGINAYAGGIFALGNITLAESTVSGNSTAGEFASGGGIRSRGGLMLSRSTISDNHAMHSSATGGGIWNGYNPIIITDSIIAGNTAGGGMLDIDPGSGSLNVDFSLIQQTGLPLVGSGNITGSSAKLAPLADNGGPTKTHALLVGSPAIDAGDPNFTTPPDFDQRGAPFVRVANGGVGGLRIDIGAYERQTVAGLNLVVDTHLDENDGDYSSGDLSLREAVGLANGSVGADTITFDTDIFATPQTITLGLGEMEITEALTIDATGLSYNVTIDANQQSRIFDIGTFFDFFDISLVGLTLTGGKTTAEFDHGGAIRSNTRGILNITNSTVSGNSTTNHSALGGGIYSEGKVSLINSTVSGNSTAGSNARGGGIFGRYNVSLTNSTVSGNSTTGSGARGGGIYIQDNISLTSSTVSGNSTAGSNAGGGGILIVGNVSLTDSTVSGNSTTGSGARGGGILSYFGTISLMQSTITGNYANDPSAIGGGIASFFESIIITNSIVDGNTAGGGMPDIEPGTGSLNVDFSLIGNTTGLTIVGVGNITGLSANLGTLADNGGPTKTHALLAGSPAIDAGDPSFTFNAAEFDQRGNPFVRVFDGDAIAGARIDMGAYERQTLPLQALVVDSTVDENDGNYSAGDLSLREAIDLAGFSIGADTITFDAAVFASPQTITLSLGEMVITEAVTINGPGQQLLTIDAQQQSRGIHITATTGDFTIAGLSLTGGRTIVPGSVRAGGGIRSLTTGSLTLDNSTVSGNATEGTFSSGGGISAAGAVHLLNSTVTGNSATGSGGGVFTTGAGAVTLTISTVSGNSTSGYEAYGGGIAASGIGDVTLTASTVSGNSTAGERASGGGIYANFGEVTLSQSTVSENMTTGDSASGGGIAGNGDVSLVQSTVSGNNTSGVGASGGGIFTFGEVTLAYSTVADNHANDSAATGGGIWNLNNPIVITNSIVADNSAGGGMPDIRSGGGSLNVDFSQIEDVTGLTILGSNNITGSDPLLGPLAGNGGPTQTHALLPGSPATDMGDPSIVFSPTEFDQRGAPFVRVSGGRIDMGAFESQPIVISADFDGDNDVDGYDFLAWQRGFGTPNAQKADGDADNDMDVDGADLGVWQLQYGTVPPLAPFESFGLSIESREFSNSSQPLLSRELVDLALAMEWMGVMTEEQSGFVKQRPSIEAAPAETDEVDPGTPEPVAERTAEADSLNEDAEETEDDEPWLTEELLEQVFG